MSRPPPCWGAGVQTATEFAGLASLAVDVVATTGACLLLAGLYGLALLVHRSPLVSSAWRWP